MLSPLQSDAIEEGVQNFNHSVKAYDDRSDSKLASAIRPATLPRSFRMSQEALCSRSASLSVDGSTGERADTTGAVMTMRKRIKKREQEA